MKMPWDQAVLPLEPRMHLPRLDGDPRSIALEHVRALLARGYTEARADEDQWAGDGALHGGPAGGCEIKHGKIRVPLYGDARYVFSFRELAAEARSQSTSTCDEPRK